MIDVYFDMDGTLAEYRNLRLTQEDFETPGYFKTLRKQDNIVEASRILSKRPDMRVHVLSAVYQEQPIREKNEWLDKYAPWIKRRIYVPVGADKAKYVGKLDSMHLLLDDYTVNLRAWERAGGTGIKIMNGLNGHGGTWKGNAISAERTGREISDAVLFIAFDAARYRDSKNVDLSAVIKDRHKSRLSKQLESTKPVLYNDRDII